MYLPNHHIAADHANKRHQEGGGVAAEARGINRTHLDAVDRSQVRFVHQAHHFRAIVDALLDLVPPCNRTAFLPALRTAHMHMHAETYQCSSLLAAVVI